MIINKIRQRRETSQQEQQAAQPRILALNKIDKQKDHIINQQNYIFQSRPAQQPAIDVHADFLNNQKYQELQDLQKIRHYIIERTNKQFLNEDDIIEYLAGLEDIQEETKTMIAKLVFQTVYDKLDNIHAPGDVYIDDEDLFEIINEFIENGGE